MSCTIYQIFKQDTFSNSHGVNRDETWTARRFKEFDTHQEALEYAVQMNLKDIVRFYQHPTFDQCVEFMSNDTWYGEVDYFVGPPDQRKLNRWLDKQGIHQAHVVGSHKSCTNKALK
jgi:hypothetical protein